jgi:hypothetical protein
MMVFMAGYYNLIVVIWLVSLCIIRGDSFSSWWVRSIYDIIDFLIAKFWSYSNDEARIIMVVGGGMDLGCGMGL